MSRQSGKTAFPAASLERRGSGKALGQGVEGKAADGEGRPEDRSPQSGQARPARPGEPEQNEERIEERRKADSEGMQGNRDHKNMRHRTEKGKTCTHETSERNLISFKRTASI